MKTNGRQHHAGAFLGSTAHFATKASGGKDAGFACLKAILPFFTFPPLRLRLAEYYLYAENGGRPLGDRTEGADDVSFSTDAPGRDAAAQVVQRRKGNNPIWPNAGDDNDKPPVYDLLIRRYRIVSCRFRRHIAEVSLLRGGQNSGARGLHSARERKRDKHLRRGALSTTTVSGLSVQKRAKPSTVCLHPFARAAATPSLAPKAQVALRFPPFCKLLIVSGLS